MLADTKSHLVAVRKRRMKPSYEFDIARTLLESPAKSANTATTSKRLPT